MAEPITKVYASRDWVEEHVDEETAVLNSAMEIDSTELDKMLEEVLV